MEITKIVKNLNFDNLDDDMFAETFSEAQITKDFAYEDAIPNALDALPKDYIWYLKNYGSRAVNAMEYRVNIDEDTSYIVPFQGFVEPQEACQQYRYKTCMGSYNYRLEDDVYVLDTKFLPITLEDKGKMLVLDFKDKIGTVWQFPALLDCHTHGLAYQPSLVAGNFTEFLSLIKPSQWSSFFKDTLLQQGYQETDKISNVWKKNIRTAEEIFYAVLKNYENNTETNYIEFKNENIFLKTLLEEPEKITINEPRAVELFYLSFNWNVKNEIDFKESILKIRKLKSVLTRKREQGKLTPLEQHTNTGFSTIGTAHNFYKMILTSTMNGLQCKETFVLYKNPATQHLSFVKRIQIEKEDLKLKGIGTFEFDVLWYSKRKKKTKWSEIPATIYLNQSEENFTEDYINFIKQTINDSSFKDKLEKFIFDYYQINDYSEFLAMLEPAQDYFEDDYPKVKSPAQIWQLLGDEFDIHFIDKQTVEMRFQYLPDDAHGLTINITNGEIKNEQHL